MTPPILNKPVTSREYKLMLNTEYFSPWETGANDFWSQVIASIITAQGGEAKKKFEVKKRRVWYLDTTGCKLRQNNFVLRLREEMEAAKKYKLTLKYRHPDRYLSASQADVVSTDARFDEEDVETKFEEDILRQFASKFAHSTSVRFNARPKVQTMADLLAVFPALNALDMSPDISINQVNDFEACEIKCEAGKIDFGEKPKLKPCLSFWYLPSEVPGQPSVAEFSFDYDVSKKERKRLKEQPDHLETFPLLSVAQAAAFFETLHEAEEIKKWFDFDGTTKTAYAYRPMKPV